MANWRNLFPNRILERGINYYRAGKVKEFDFTDDQGRFKAIVTGTGPLSYSVIGRLRHDGRASGISCSCPWSSKGHRCKHEVAALLTAEDNMIILKPKKQQKESLADHIDPVLKEHILAASEKDNPLKIVQDCAYSPVAYAEARDLSSKFEINRYKFTNLGSNDYLFELDLVNGFLHVNIEINFNKNTIKSVEIHSPIYNYSQDALAIVGLVNFVGYFFTEQPFEQTNTIARRFLAHFRVDKQNQEPIILQAQLTESSYNSLTLSFKLGHPKHLYKLQSLVALLDYIESGEKVRLGKYFDQVIELSQMDHDSLAWYHFLQILIGNHQAIQEARDEYYGGTFKELFVDGIIADQIDAILSTGVKAYDQKQPVQYVVKHEQLPFDVKVDPQTHLTTIKVGKITKHYDEIADLISGHNHFYRYANRQWIKYDSISPEFLHKYAIEMGDELQFGPRELKTVGREILPTLAKNKHLSFKGAEKLEAILPPEAKFRYRLDYKNEEIVAWPIVSYGTKQYSLLNKIAYPEREIDKEKNALQALADLAFTKAKDHYFLSLGDSEKVDQFLKDGIDQLNKIGEVEVTTAFKKLLHNVKQTFKASLGIKLSDNTLTLTVSGEKLKPEDIQAILTAYQEKKHYFVLKNGQVRNIASPSLDELNETMRSLGLSLKQFVKGKMAVPAYRAFYLDKRLKNSNLDYSSNAAFKKVINDLKQDKLPHFAIPKKLQGVLRPYQQKGFEWLSTLVNYNFGALLADEMGLGKTLQVLSLILARKKHNHLPDLVIAPASVIYNWQHEVQKFTPELTARVIDGNKLERQEMLQKAKQYDILIISYDSLKRDVEFYQDLHFDLEIIDEAQNIKNARSLAAKAVKVINGHRRLALTGTPIENNLSELWSIFDYLMPGFLGKYDHFRKVYEKPIVKEDQDKVAQRLSEMVAPFVLRRLKKDVLKNLPHKSEEIVYAKITGKQKELYEAQAQKIIGRLHLENEQDFKKQRFAVLAELTKLRELCCDPHLLYENYRGKSAKLVTTINLIERYLNADHKILLFSQFTSMLAIIKQKLLKKKIAIFEITGATPKEKRQALINQFNSLKQPAVFLISLKAGGTGINLTSADIVIHYDPWWNVAAENQASDRAHRIGQKHTVQIFKIVAKDTVEEKIIALQQKKAKLAEEVLTGKQLGLTTLKRSDLLQILER